MGDGKHEKTQHGLLPSATYDNLKFMALVVLPAFGAAYFSLAGVWGLPKAEEVVGTTSIIATFVGGLVAASKKVYDNSPRSIDGVVKVQGTGEERVVTGLALPEIEGKDLKAGQKLVVKVQPADADLDPSS